MRRHYISPEFKYVKTHGSMSMLEQTSFFGSKMMDIMDSLSITNENIIYYQGQGTNEQLSLLIEKNTTPIVYNTINDKKENHSIRLDQAQSSVQSDSNARWIVEINTKSILNNYLFATLKKYRTFEGVRNNMTIYNSIDVAIKDYISKNILNRYRYKSVDLFVSYQPFSQDGILKHQNQFVEITDTLLITNKIQSILNSSGERLTINFNQEKPASEYNFNYYFNLYFEKI